MPRLLTPEKQREVLDAIPQDQRAIFLALAYHGLRPIEATRLSCGDFERGRRTITATLTKTKKARTIPCSDELFEALLGSVHNRIAGPLFNNPRARSAEKRWKVDSLEKVWNRAAKLVGAQASLYEGTKHSSATAARRRGVPLEVIQRALGHADARSTAVYAKAAELAPVGVLRGKRK